MNGFHTSENEDFIAGNPKYLASMTLVDRLGRFRSTLDGFALQQCDSALAQSSLSAEIALLLHDLSQCDRIDNEMSLRIKSTYQQMLGFIAGLSKIGRIATVSDDAIEPTERD